MVIVHNLSGVAVDKAFIKKIAEVVLKAEKKSKPRSENEGPVVRETLLRGESSLLQGNQDISIVLVNSDKMKALNQQYRHKNGPTDVLTFPELDIVICPKVVKDNAKEAKSIFRAELARVVIHGVLHFLDYDHEKSEKDAKAMRDKEGKYFKKVK